MSGLLLTFSFTLKFHRTLLWLHVHLSKDNWFPLMGCYLQLLLYHSCAVFRMITIDMHLYRFLDCSVWLMKQLKTCMLLQMRRKTSMVCILLFTIFHYRFIDVFNLPVWLRSIFVQLCSTSFVLKPLQWTSDFSAQQTYSIML